MEGETATVASSGMDEVQMDARKRHLSLSGGDIWFLLEVVTAEVYGHGPGTLSAVSYVCVETNGVKKQEGTEL